MADATRSNYAIDTVQFGEFIMENEIHIVSQKIHGIVQTAIIFKTMPLVAMTTVAADTLLFQ